MDFRIGAKSPVYYARQTSKVADRALKADFARMMAEEKESINDISAVDCKIPGTPTGKADFVMQDTVVISENLLEAEAEPARPAPLSSDDTVVVEKSPLTGRLESVHKKIEDMDFTGKSAEEVYKTIVDVYEDEFGFIGYLFHTDEESYYEVKEDREMEILMAMEDIAQKPDYKTLQSREFYRRAMGYDKMTDEEKIAAIKERVGGSSYCHRYAELAELERAGVITSEQSVNISSSLYRQSKIEYCEANGLDYMRFVYPWDFGENVSEKDMSLRAGNLTAWASKAGVTWLEVFEGVRDNPALHGWEKSAVLKKLDETIGLLSGSDRV